VKIIPKKNPSLEILQILQPVLPLLLLFLGGNLIGSALTLKNFKPEINGELQMTVQVTGLAEADADNSELMAATVAGWLESPTARKKIGFPFQIRRPVRQILAIDFSTPTPAELHFIKRRIERVLNAELTDFEKSNAGLLNISNQSFSASFPSPPIQRNGFIIGAFLALALLTWRFFQLPPR